MAAIAAQTLSLAAAHGLTPATLQSWYPALVRTPRVLVPIELQVLMVRDATLSWADCAMTTPPAANHGADAPATPAAGLLPPPFTELATPRARGAYLQWYLPSGLTSGTAEAGTNKASFPAIPDRWLVLRISPGRTPLRRAVTGWVLEAGIEPARVTPLANWSEPGPATGMQNPLTALGHGDLAWAGYFDNVQNRLGFADLALDEVTGPLSYLVCGWYADPSADPLGSSSVTSLAAFNARMQTLGWELDAGQLAEVVSRRKSYFDVIEQLGLHAVPPQPADYTTNGSWWPQATVFHGATVNIDWPGASDAAEVGGPPASGAITVAAGNTLAEALAALISTANGKPDEAAIVEALQCGGLAELDQPDGRAKLDAQLHTTSFGSLPGGPPSSEPFTIAPSGPPAAPSSTPPAPAPGIFGQQPSSGGKVSGRGEILQQSHGRPELLAQPVGQLSVPSGHPGIIAAERVQVGGLSSIITALGGGAVVPPTDPGGNFAADRAVPRFYVPKDPVLLVQGGKRAFTHDSSVQTENGMVVCRLTPVSELSWTMPQLPGRFGVFGTDILESGVSNGSVPVECEGLLQETVLLDNGAAPVIAANMAARQNATQGNVTRDNAAFDSATAARNIAVEQTVWTALRNKRVDAAPLLARSGITGMLPAPFAVAQASRPWTPIHLDWSVEFLPSPGGEDDWTLGELDFTLNEGAVIPAAGSGIMCQGRSTLTGGASATLASAILQATNAASRIGGSAPVPAAGIEKHFSELAGVLSASFRALTLGNVTAGASAPGASGASGSDPALLEDIASALASMDILSCGLNGILTQLRGGLPGDGTSQPAGGIDPTPFFALRAGFLRIVRLRLVDGFGQFVDLCGSSATQAAQNYLVSGPLAVPDQPLLLGLPPRFSAPSRAWLRYMSADTPGVEANYQTSPLCGFLVPNHLDASLEFFNADGSAGGALQPDDQDQVTWQGAPGLPSSAGLSPGQALANPYIAQLAAALVDWGGADAGQSREPALAALLRTIDSTLWAVDPYGHQGDEHTALLLGHPICVMRGLLRLDVAETVLTPEGALAAIAVRLGNLTHWEDGLLGYFINDDYTRLYAADAAIAGMARAVGPNQGFLQQINLVPDYYASFADDVAANATSTTPTPGTTPVSHPYVDTTGLLTVRPNQTINLTMLVEPFSAVHATLGLVPRKQIGMRRAWVNAGLTAIAPTFRFGPVLVDPKTIRMPLATGLHGSWVWDNRADAVNWAENPVTNATDNALLGSDPAQAVEGWLKLLPPKPGPAT